MELNKLFINEDNVNDRKLVYDFDGDIKAFLEYDDKNEDVKTFLSKFVDYDLRVTVNLRINIIDNITSQIIHYKDAFKIENPALWVPYFVYGRNKDKDIGVIIINRDIYNGYLYGKALYYCLTEKEAIFENSMNNMITFYLDDQHIDDVYNSFKDVFEGNNSLGYIQRYYDRIYISNMGHLKEMCINESTRIFNRAKELLEVADDKEPIIKNAIGCCYLLKKTMYVHYMKAKNLLATRYDNDIKQLRSAAKEAADSIPFVSYSELWRYKEMLKDQPKIDEIEGMVDAYEDDENYEKAETPEEFARRVLGIEE